ncbi:Extracellular solute-binding protein [Candidatus Electrothrix laxa]
MHIVHYFFIFILSIILYNPLLSGESNASQLNWIGHWKGADKRQQLIEEIKREYEFIYPDVKVNLRYNEDLDAPGATYKWKAANTIVRMIKTGNIDWDIIYLGVTVYHHVSELLGDPNWGEKHLVDFNTIPSFPATQKNFINTNPWYKQQTGGILVGPMIEGFILCLWYNPQVARKIGIKVKERNMTTEDFISYARATSEYNKKNKAAIPFVKLGIWNRMAYLFEYLFKSQFVDPKFAIEEKFDQRKLQPFLDTLRIFEQLAAYQPFFNRNWRKLSWNEWETDFLDDDGLFIVAGTFMYSHFRGKNPEKAQKLIPVEFPYVHRPNGLVGDYINTFAVMKRSPNRDRAVDMLMLWAEPKVAEEWVEYTMNPTGLKGNICDPVTASLDRADVYGSFLSDMTKKYGKMPMRYFRVPTYVFGIDCPVNKTEFHEKLACILEGKITAQEYYDELYRRFQKKRKKRHQTMIGKHPPHEE